MSQILLVDDEIITRKVIGVQLEKLGHTVFTAASAEEARALFSENSMDMAFVDLMLGDQSGLDLLQPFKEHNPDCQIVLITAYASMETAIDAMHLGASDYLAKPVQPHELVRAVKQCLEHKRVIEEKHRLEEENRQYHEHLEDRVRAQAADTVESEKRFRTIFETIHDLYYRTDMEGHITSISPSCLHLTGYSPEEIIGTDITTYYVDPDQRDALLQALQKNGEVNDFEVEMEHKDGTHRMAATTSHIVFDQAHHPIAIEGIARDITERKQAEQLVQEENRVLEMLSTGHTLCEVLKALNLMVESQVPDTRSSILIMDNSGKHLLSGSAPNLPEAYNTALDGVAIGPSAGSCGTAAYKNETVIVEDIATDPLWKDYKDLALAHGLKACWSVPIHSSEDKVLGTFALYDDKPRHPTEAELKLIAMAAHIAGIAIGRKQAEKALKKSEKSFRNLVESAFDAIIVHKDMKVLYANTAAKKMFGVSNLQDVLGQSVLSYVHPHFRSFAEKRVNQVVRKQQSIPPVELKAVLQTGDELDIDIASAPITYEDNAAVLSVVRDITERKAMEEQLRQAQKMEALGTLVGGVAHDFNNMLAGITGNLYLAIRKSEGRPEVMEKLKNVESLSFRAADMISQLMTFARKSMIKIQPLPLLTFIKEAVKLAQVSVPENVRMRSSFCREELIIKGDATQLQQVLMNLLSNARDAVADKAKPEINVELEALEADEGFKKAHPDLGSHRLARMTVSDNGHGVPEDHLENIFEPFFTTKGAGEGTGLGLAMVYGTVQSHGGVVQVESEMGKGTSFHIYLPLEEEEAEALVENQEESVSGHGETLLLADDERHVRETGKAVLESLGYKVLEAADGEEAVALFRTHRDEILLVILDMVMPKMGGVEAMKEIRGMRPDIPVICATGYDREHALGEKAAECFDLVLSKPFSITVLSQSVHSLLEASK